MDEPPALDLRPELCLGFQAGTREEVLDQWQQGTQAAGTNLRQGPEFEVKKISGSQGAFEITLKDRSVIIAKDIVLAIGLQGNLRTFGVDGDHLPHVTYQLADPAAHSDKQVLVVGVGDAGIENALALAEQNEVGIVNRRDEFARAKPRNRSLIESAIKNGEVTHHSHATVKQIEEGQVILDTRDGDLAVPCDLILGRLGAIPPRKFLQEIGVEFPSEDPAGVPQVSGTYESNVPGVYMVGAIVGYPLIKHCMNQGCEVIDYILGIDVVRSDEALLAKKFEGIPGSVNEVLDSIQQTVPLFDGVTSIQLREFLVDSTFHRPASGETIYERNDFSTSIYSILRGTVEVIAPASDSDSDTTYDDGKKKEPARFPIPKGQFFGEMSLISGRRRSASVVAGNDCILIETPLLSMIKLMNSVQRVRRVIDETFILRKLQNSLGAGIPFDDLQALATTAVIESFKHGEVMFSQGDETDGLHLVRRGSVTVSRQQGGTNQILAYLPAGNIVGEMALFNPAGLRSATVTAAMFTETIRVPAAEIFTFLEKHPGAKRELQALEGQRMVENAMRTSGTSSSALVDFLMGAGAGEATDLLLIEESLCIRCDNCETACAETHGGVSRLDREAGPTFETAHIPTSCRHCENPKCMTDCPPDALRRHPNGEVYILDSCIGCGNCASNCPYGVIRMAAVKERRPRSALLGFLFGWAASPVTGAEAAPNETKRAVKCDLCMKLPERRGQPRAACVASCPTGAILRINPKDYVDRLLEADD
jgi:Fe-S-cluster-containing dehydrogenase component/CRP-like cAMP-binding protein/thioredoxin reductase